jgi:hypothetical protein
MIRIHSLELNCQRWIRRRYHLSPIPYFLFPSQWGTSFRQIACKDLRQIICKVTVARKQYSAESPLIRGLIIGTCDDSRQGIWHNRAITVSIFPALYRAPFLIAHYHLDDSASTRQDCHPAWLPLPPPTVGLDCQGNPVRVVGDSTECGGCAPARARSPGSRTLDRKLVNGDSRLTIEF